MSEERRDPLERWRDESQGLTMLDSPPSVGYVIHEVARRTESDPLIWAWCKVDVAGPGYTEVSFTKADGSTPADPGGGTLVLGAVITKLWC